jgi:hypothetical protein
MSFVDEYYYLDTWTYTLPLHNLHYLLMFPYWLGFESCTIFLNSTVVISMF